MRRTCIAFLLFDKLLSMPLCAQEIFIKGDNPAATRARTDLEKLTRYKSSLDDTHAFLVVDRESRSPDFPSPATVAVTMKLMTLRGDLLWSKTKPFGPRSEEVVAQDLLKELAKANPRLGERVNTSSRGGRGSQNKLP